MSKEALIVGGGISGLTTASELARDPNFVVTLVTHDVQPAYRSVYTTFSPNDLFGKFHEALKPVTAPVEGFRLLSSNGFDLSMKGVGYVMVDYPGAIEVLKARLPISVNKLVVSQNAVMSIEEYPDQAVLYIDNHPYDSELLIDCTGDSALSRPLNDNPVVEYVFGGVFRGQLDRPELIIVYLDQIGGTCWVCPSVNPGYVDIVVSAWGWRNRKTQYMEEGKARLNRLVHFMREKKVGNISNIQPEELFSGTIRSQPIPAMKTGRVFAAGDVAGMAKPKTGDGFRWALWGGLEIASAVSAGMTPYKAHLNWRRKRQPIHDDLLFGATLHRLNRQREGSLAESLIPLSEVFNRSPRLRDAVEQFLVSGKFDLRMLPSMMKYVQFSEVLIGSLICQIRVLIDGVDSIEPFDTLPSLN